MMRKKHAVELFTPFSSRQAAQNAKLAAQSLSHFGATTP